MYLYCMCNMSTNKQFKHTHLLTHQHLHPHSQTPLGYDGCGFWIGGWGLELGLECLNLWGWMQTLRNNWGLACHTGQPVTLAGSLLLSQSHSGQKPGRRRGLAVPSTADPDWWWWRWRWARMNWAFPLRHWSLARCPQCSSQLLLRHTPVQEMEKLVLNIILSRRLVNIFRQTYVEMQAETSFDQLLS